MRRLFLLLATAFACLTFGASSALAISPVIKNCTQNAGNRLTKHFSVKQLESALNSMPATDQQYTGCAQAIETQILKQTGRFRLHGNGSGGGSGFPTILVIVIVLVVLAGGGYGLYAYRRR